SGAGVGSRGHLLFDVGHHAIPRITDVAGGAPQVTADVGSPFFHAAHAVFAQAIDNRPASRGERVSHFLVDGLQCIVLVDRARAAPVVLQVIDAPGSPHLRILRFVTVAGWIAGAGAWT